MLFAVFLLEIIMLTKQETLKLIKSIATRGASLEKDVQSAAIASVYYSVCHGDVTIGQKLVEQFPAGMRKAALVGFLEEFGQFEYKDKNVIYKKNDKLAKLLEDVEGATAYAESIKVQWIAFKPETIKSKFDCLDAVRKLVARMEREIKAGNSLHSEAYDAVAAALELLEEPVADDGDQEEILEMTPEAVTAEIAQLIQKAA